MEEEELVEDERFFLRRRGGRGLGEGAREWEREEKEGEGGVEGEEGVGEGVMVGEGSGSIFLFPTCLFNSSQKLIFEEVGGGEEGGGGGGEGGWFVEFGWFYVFKVCLWREGIGFGRIMLKLWWNVSFSFSSSFSSFSSFSFLSFFLPVFSPNGENLKKEK